jgi:hypothetical protein
MTAWSKVLYRREEDEWREIQVAKSDQMSRVKVSEMEVKVDDMFYGARLIDLS